MMYKPLRCAPRRRGRRAVYGVAKLQKLPSTPLGSEIMQAAVGSLDVLPTPQGDEAAARKFHHIIPRVIVAHPKSRAFHEMLAIRIHEIMLRYGLWRIAHDDARRTFRDRRHHNGAILRYRARLSRHRQGQAAAPLLVLDSHLDPATLQFVGVAQIAGSRLQPFGGFLDRPRLAIGRQNLNPSDMPRARL